MHVDKAKNQEADIYKDKDSWFAFNKTRVLNRSFSLILTIEDTYAYFYSISIM